MTGGADQAGTGLLPDVGVCDLLSGVWDMRKDAGSILRALPVAIPKPDAYQSSIGKTFQEAAARHAGRDFLRFEGQSWTYRECNARVNRIADFLTRQGVGRGDVVAILSRNHPDVVLGMLAVVKLGAIAGMLNFNQRGSVLEHSLGLLEAKVLLYQEELSDVLDSVDADALPSSRFGFDELSDQLVTCSPVNPKITASITIGEPAIYIFTSGTTGYPKASKMSHNRWLTAAGGIGGVGVRLRSDDVMYTALPFYHNNALTISVASAMVAGACLAIGRQFSASNFFDDIIANGATSFSYIGELCRYLLAQPEKPTDRAHSVRVIVGNGLRPDIWDAFTERFGIDRVCELYAASESNIGFVNMFGIPKTAGFSPLTYLIVEYDEETGLPIRDDKGRVIPVGRGGVGLLIAEINKRVPFDGYTDPEASKKKVVTDARKPGDRWYNSGDVVRDQGFSHIGFVDRIGDTFRWKGENVATTEVEAVIDSYPGVQESVVFGVQMAGADGRAGMAALALEDGVELDRVDFARHLREGLPAYAVPLFFRLVDEIEHTSTFKNIRAELRKQAYSETGADPLLVLPEAADRLVDSYPEFLTDWRSAPAEKV